MPGRFLNIRPQFSCNDELVHKLLDGASSHVAADQTAVRQVAIAIGMMLFIPSTFTIQQDGFEGIAADDFVHALHNRTPNNDNRSAETDAWRSASVCAWCLSASPRLMAA